MNNRPPISGFVGLVGERPAGPRKPAGNSHSLKLQLADLAAHLGLAKVFANHTDISRLLDLLQDRLLHFSVTQESPTPITELDTAGLRRCRDFFASQLPTPLRDVTAQNRAGAMLALARVSADKAAAQLTLQPEVKFTHPHLETFLSELAQLLHVLEHYEYHQSHIVY